MSRVFIGSLILLLLACAVTSGQAPPAVRSELAPTGVLRVGINYSNGVLATKDPASGEPRGVAVDLAGEVARRLGVSTRFVTYAGAGLMAEAVTRGEWDIAFLAADPARAADIAFTSPYLEIDATYLVPQGSPLRTIDDVDRAGVRVAVVAQTAYDLFLSRSLMRAELVRVNANAAADAALIAGSVHALAGLKDRLLTVAEQVSGSRVLDGRFTAAQQSIGLPTGRAAAQQYMNAFVEDAKRSGLVARAIAKTGARGVSVAPAGTP